MRSLITIALATLLLAPLARANEGGEDGRTGSDVEPAVEVVQPEVEAAAVPPTAGLVASPMAEYQARRLQLADRAIKKGAVALGTTGKPFTPQNIGSVLATRDLMSDLRDLGAVTGGPPPLQQADRSRFLQALDTAIQAIRRRNPTN